MTDDDVAKASDKEDNNNDDGMDEDHVPVKSSKGGRKKALSAPDVGKGAKTSKGKKKAADHQVWTNYCVFASQILTYGIPDNG
jgi:hypothetical protein